MNILITGCAGFIGFNLVKSLLQKKNIKILGIDNLNNYYDTKLKYDRLNIIKKLPNFKFKKLDITDEGKLKLFFKNKKFDIVVNLAAQAGVRYSFKNPKVYIDTNVIGFYNLLECCKSFKIKKLLFASSSSVYGEVDKFPLKENFNTDLTNSLYGSTKKINEVMAATYSKLYKINCIGLRFFTVYGPYGRPDMSLYKFTKSINEGKQVQLFNYGNHVRDFTYIDDVVESIKRLILVKNRKKIDKLFDIYNIGSNNPKSLIEYVQTIEKLLGRKAKIVKKPFQKGDIIKTHASVNKLFKKTNYKPSTKMINGIKSYIDWYKSYYK